MPPQNVLAASARLCRPNYTPSPPRQLLPVRRAPVLLNKFYEKEITVITMETLGTVVKEFARDGESGRKSEGAFIGLHDGRIAFVFSRYRVGREDGDACDLAASFSTDDGRTFSDERIVLRCEDCDARNIMSVSLLPMRDGKIGVFYLKKQTELQCRMFMRTTHDFETFSAETCCIADRGYFVVNNDRVVRLKSWRIVIPAAYIDTAQCGDMDHDTAHDAVMPPAAARFYVSDDDGKTFFLAGGCAMPHAIFKTGLQEPGIVELNDGRILGYFRNQSGRHYVAVSTDGCATWTTPEPSEFTAPPSPMTIKRLADGRLIAIYNPVPLYPGRSETVGKAWLGARTPLVLRLSTDDGATFGPLVEIENDPLRGFCYCAVYQTVDAILLGYCAGGEADQSCLTRTRIRRIPQTQQT